jgi:hypothetical protein
MRLPSFRVRTLMLTVGVVGMLLWGGMMGTRAYVYFRLAREYGAYERGWRYMAARDRANPARARTVSAVWGVQTADYYAPLARKYRRAMWCPWIPVEPDPPAPTFGAPPG